VFIRRSAIVAVCALLALPALAQDKVKLEWKFEKDKTFYQEMTTKTEQGMKVMGQDVSQKQEQTLYFSYTPKEVDKDGNWTIAQKIEGFKMTININNQPISFDSTAPAGTTNNATLGEFFKQLVGTEFKLTVDKSMKVTKVEGKDTFVKNLSTSNPQMEVLLKKILTDESMKQMADPTFGMLPGKEVTKGETWKKDSKLSLGPIGGYDNTYTYTYEGKDEKDPNLHKVKVDTTLKYTTPSEAEGLPFKIKSANLTAKDSKGTLRFNAAKGRLEDSELHLQLDGSLDIEIAGTTTKVELTQKTDTTIKCMDTNPVQPKK
jgi:Family of unknown function (DUF6263)